MQIVWLSFFNDRQKNIQFTDPRHLIGFLAEVARNKVVNEFRKQLRTSKRDLRREHAGNGGGSLLLEELPARQPTPSEFAIAHNYFI